MKGFIPAIYKWFDENKRDLPWRRTTDPYKIWISEIMLQQTRVDQGIPYYNRFIGRFPELSDLAKAEEDEVLKLWQGLGYYSRARNLHKTAREIYYNHRGIFPDSYHQICSLKGIGPYTAAAIASIAFHLPYPALDGNVYRLLARYFGIFESTENAKGKRIFSEIAAKLLSDKNPGFHNQALMEFGALQCRPKSPNCASCPLSGTCYAFTNEQTENLPVRKQKGKNIFRYFCFYLIESGEMICLEKRTGNDIWKNLYQFPLLETKNELSEKEILSTKPSFLKGYKLNVKSVSDREKHVLSHQTIFARLIHVETGDNFNPESPLFKVPKKMLGTYAIPRLMEKLIKKQTI